MVLYRCYSIYRLTLAKNMKNQYYVMSSLQIESSFLAGDQSASKALLPAYFLCVRGS